MARRLIAKGAEANIYWTKEHIVKIRPKKRYRIEEIDLKLRKLRTRSEAKILQKLSKAGFNCPRVDEVDDTKMHLKLEYIKGYKVRDILGKDNCKKACAIIGDMVAQLHNLGIIHGDLTTSNMLLRQGDQDDLGSGPIDAKYLFMIDFGLSYFSAKFEDKAVDLHLLKQALESKHPMLADEAIRYLLKAYKKRAKCAEDIINRLEVVESRGRYKRKGR